MKWSEEELHAHFRSAHHYCESCKIVTNTARGLQEHFRQASAHQPRQQLIRSYRCELCGETFHTASNLREVRFLLIESLLNAETNLLNSI